VYVSTSAPSHRTLKHGTTGGRGSSKLVKPRWVPFLLLSTTTKDFIHFDFCSPLNCSRISEHVRHLVRKKSCAASRWKKFTVCLQVFPFKLLCAVAGTASDIIRHEAAATNRAQRRVGSGCFRWVKGVLFEAMSK